MPTRESEPEGSVRAEGPEQLFQRYYRPVLTFFMRRGFSEEESRDLAQETFLRVYKQMDGFRGESSLETWLFQIAQNLYKNTLRSLSAQKRDAAEVPLSEPGDLLAFTLAERSNPLREVLIEERARLLRKALDDLLPQMRQCVQLRVDSDLKYREIAELMRLSIETVKAHLFQARELLRNSLAGYFTDAGEDR